MTAPSTPSRRALVLGLGGVGLTGLGGCRVRLEDGVRLPFDPAPSTQPGAAGLTRLVADTDALAADPPGKAPLRAILGRLHQEQATLLTRATAGKALPSHPPSSATSQPSAAARELAAYGVVGDLVGVAMTLRPTIGALLTQRCTAARLLGTPPTMAESVSELDGSFLDQPVQRLDAAVFWLEVVAARSRDAQRSRALATRDALSALLAEWADAAPGYRPQLGYPLPRSVSSAGEAARLAQSTLRDLLATWGAALPAATSERSGPALRRLPVAMSLIEVQAYRWGAPLTAFPGLRAAAS